jgi:hypothetical protein
MHEGELRGLKLAITSRSLKKTISVARSFNASSVEKIAVKMYAFQS